MSTLDAMLFAWLAMTCIKWVAVLATVVDTILQFGHDHRFGHWVARPSLPTSQATEKINKTMKSIGLSKPLGPNDDKGMQLNTDKPSHWVLVIDLILVGIASFFVVFVLWPKYLYREKWRYFIFPDRRIQFFLIKLFVTRAKNRELKKKP